MKVVADVIERHDHDDEPAQQVDRYDTPIARA